MVSPLAEAMLILLSIINTQTKEISVNCFRDMLNSSQKNVSKNNRCAAEDLREFSKDIQTIDAPKLHCVENQSIIFTFNQSNEGLAYFLEYANNKNFKNSSLSNVTTSDVLQVTNVSSDNNLTFRLWGVSPDFKIYRSDPMEVFYEHYDQIKSVSNLSLSDLTLMSNKTFRAKIVWDPGNDYNCHFFIISYLRGKMNSVQVAKLDMTTKSHIEYYLYNMKIGNNFRKKYTVEVVSVKSGKESVKKGINITIPTCLEVFNSLVNCSPSTPKIIGIKKFNCFDSDENLTKCNVELDWMTPKFLPNNYTAILFTQSPYQKLANKYEKLNISGGSNTTIFTDVIIEESFHLILKANSEGGTTLSEYTGSMKLLKDFTNYGSYVWIWAITCVVLLLILLLALITHIMLKKRRYLQENYRTENFWNNLFLKNNLLNKYYIQKYVATENQDPEWEKEEKNVSLENIIGVGAFGIVQRGYFKMDSKKKTEVAVKMLKAKPTEEQIRQFYGEMELMKTVPKHPHIVQLIGVVTKTRYNNPLMLVEYCAKGDLQSFLKKVWIALGNRENSFDSNDSGFCRDFSNDFYEVDVKIPDPEYILKSRDLLSFARQIAIGMEFLSNLKIIHRDLATRNILLTEDNTVKISDFGLSRDVYTNNMYKKTTCGKLPFRWMALESLTHQIYTTESEVWSFGIVLWEIVTLGGYPYPAVYSQDLIAYLKEGNRMERPINCTRELYSIMLQCWDANPKERPLFANLRDIFEKMLETEVEYVNMEDVRKINSNYYQNLEESKLE